MPNPLSGPAVLPGLLPAAHWKRMRKPFRPRSGSPSTDRPIWCRSSWLLPEGWQPSSSTALCRRYSAVFPTRVQWMPLRFLRPPFLSFSGSCLFPLSLFCQSAVNQLDQLQYASEMCSPLSIRPSHRSLPCGMFLLLDAYQKGFSCPAHFPGGYGTFCCNRLCKWISHRSCPLLFGVNPVSFQHLFQMLPLPIWIYDNISIISQTVTSACFS